MSVLPGCYSPIPNRAHVIEQFSRFAEFMTGDSLVMRTILEEAGFFSLEYPCDLRPRAMPVVSSNSRRKSLSDLDAELGPGIRAYPSQIMEIHSSSETTLVDRPDGMDGGDSRSMYY